MRIGTSVCSFPQVLVHWMYEQYILLFEARDPRLFGTMCVGENQAHWIWMKLRTNRNHDHVHNHCVSKQKEECIHLKIQVTSVSILM